MAGLKVMREVSRFLMDWESQGHCARLSKNANAKFARACIAVMPEVEASWEGLGMLGWGVVCDVSLVSSGRMTGEAALPCERWLPAVTDA